MKNSLRTAPTRPTAFTLVELLVVIAIIGVLVAMLLPALGKAKYRTNIVKCLANEREMGILVLQYTNDFKSFYPYRYQGHLAGGLSGQPHSLLNTPLTISDDRPLFNSFMTIDRVLTCPLSPLATGFSLNDSATLSVTSSYELWFGMGNLFAQNQSNMLRVDDRPRYVTGGKTYRFNVLAADEERDWPAQPWVNTGHPDEHYALPRNEVYTSASTASNWRGIFTSAATMTRPTIERNFLLDDGSARTRRLTFRDPSTIAVPYGSYYASIVWGYLPAMN